jgi:hypothetical protein
MSSEIFVVLILTVIAGLFIFWVRRNDRAHSKADQVDAGANDAKNGKR